MPTASPAVAAAPTFVAPASVPATSPAVGARAAAPSARPPRYPKAPPTPSAATATSPSSAATAAVSSIASAPRSTSCARCPASSSGPAYDLRRRLRRARTGQHVQAHVLSRILGQLRAECAAASPAAPAPVRSAAACAPSAVLRRRSVMEGGPCPLLAKAPASGSPARSSSTKRVPPYPWYLRARRTSSSVTSAGVRKPSSGIACRGVCCRGCGLGSSLDCTKSSR